MRRASSGRATPGAQRGVDAERAGAGRKQVEEHEAEEHRGHAAIEHRPEPLRAVELEVRDGPIWPASRNATGRVNSPSTMSAAPKTSSTPANQSCENMGGAPVHG